MVLDFTGLPQNFELESVDWGNAAAFIQTSAQGHQIRKITYRTDFFLQLNDSTGNYWASISILAHEIGHHLSGHTESQLPEYRFELEADKFSGFILNRMGASIEDARAAVEVVIKNSLHGELSRENRIAAIEAGWLLAEKSRDTTLTIPGKYPEASIMNLDPKALDGLSLFELRVMLNEIYARHGYKFYKEPDMANYFSTVAWYHRIPPNNNEPEDIYHAALSSVEKKNLAIIRQIIDTKMK